MKLVQTSDLFIKLFKDVVNKLVTGNMQEHLQDDLARSQLTKLKRQAWKDRGEIKYMAITGKAEIRRGSFLLYAGLGACLPGIFWMSGLLKSFLTSIEQEFHELSKLLALYSRRKSL